MKISEMRANKDDRGEQTATAALSLKFSLIRTRILTSTFSKTIIDTAKRFTPIKPMFQQTHVG